MSIRGSPVFGGPLAAVAEKYVNNFDQSVDPVVVLSVSKYPNTPSNGRSASPILMGNQYESRSTELDGDEDESVVCDCSVGWRIRD